MLEEDLKVKQDFLREEILEKGFDPEEFISFLNSTLKIDSDINHCSIDEIKRVVLSFKEMKESTIVEKMDKLEQSVAIKKDSKPSTIIYVSV